MEAQDQTTNHSEDWFNRNAVCVRVSKKTDSSSGASTTNLNKFYVCPRRLKAPNGCGVNVISLYKSSFWFIFLLLGTFYKCNAQLILVCVSLSR